MRRQYASYNGWSVEMVSIARTAVHSVVQVSSMYSGFTIMHLWQVVSLNGHNMWLCAQPFSVTLSNVPCFVPSAFCYRHQALYWIRCYEWRREAGISCGTLGCNMVTLGGSTLASDDLPALCIGGVSVSSGFLSGNLVSPAFQRHTD